MNVWDDEDPRRKPGISPMTRRGKVLMALGLPMALTTAGYVSGRLGFHNAEALCYAGAAGSAVGMTVVARTYPTLQ